MRCRTAAGNWWVDIRAVGKWRFCFQCYRPNGESGDLFGVMPVLTGDLFGVMPVLTHSQGG